MNPVGDGKNLVIGEVVVNELKVLKKNHPITGKMLNCHVLIFIATIENESGSLSGILTILCSQR